jgi:hypothetical protein
LRDLRSTSKTPVVSVIAAACVAGGVAIVIEVAMTSASAVPQVSETPSTTTRPTAVATLIAPSAPSDTAPDPSAIATTDDSTPLIVVPMSSALAEAPKHVRGSVFRQAGRLAASGDVAGARALLEPRVFGDRPTNEEVMLLRGICKSQHDKNCLAALAQRSAR